VPRSRDTETSAAQPVPLASAALGLAITPAGRIHLGPGDPGETGLAPATARRLADAFAASPGCGLLALGAGDLLQARLPASLAFGRELAKLFLGQLCRVAGAEGPGHAPAVPVPADELASLLAAAPPMTGGEYLTPEVLTAAWRELELQVRDELAAFDGTVAQYLRAKSPVWHVVGRVCFHLAEHKRDPDAPFAFLATYATGVASDGRVRHAPLGRAVEEYAGARRRHELLALLEPVYRASEASPWLKGLVDAGEIFHPLAWTPREAYAFLKEIPRLEASGLVVRVPDWWKARQPPRPQVQVTVGARAPAAIGLEAMLDFQMHLSLDGETLSPAEQRAILESSGGLVLLRGKWVEVDRDRLRAVLEHWRTVQKAAGRDGISFVDGMRLLAGVPHASDAADDGLAARAEWSAVTAGPWLDAMLAALRNPGDGEAADPGPELLTTLRPYQREGVAWLLLLARLRLGACLADDMGLGKTIQVIALLLLLRRHGERGPHLLVVPASLLGNWSAELERFAPTLRPLVAHPSALAGAQLREHPPAGLDAMDVVLTTYGTVGRAAWIRDRGWGLVVLDEAQAIKNPAAQQTRAVKSLRAGARIALTGTPIENRLGDLWSLFDFLDPGLLGSASAFRSLAKRIAADPQRGFAPLRSLVRPYILRRVKTDRRVIADLPDKIEVVAWCQLTRTQAALYARAVDELATRLNEVDGIERRGVVLEYLLRFKQICNHPSQWLGHGDYRPAESGKFARLGELCEPIAARQEKLLVFTQFREMTAPLSSFLERVFGRPGLVLHGGTPVGKRPGLVARFQDDQGPPFFVLSLKAGGTGLNLTAASHVVHFDRWWNPAVESQATDRAYRIGQHRNVLVHKFVCRGTIEERVDALIEAKRGLADGLLAAGAEVPLTEMSRDELLRLVALDIRSAIAEE